jgi:mono/diheme cytochrome c family protein
VQRTARDLFLEAGIWLLFAALLIPAGVVGYVIGQNDQPKTKTVTVAHAAGAAAGAAKPAPTGGAAAATVAAGAPIFAKNCSVCHGADGKGGSGGPDLTSIPSAKNFATVVKQVTNGGVAMPPFKGRLSKTQINSVSLYVTKKITGM